MSFSEDTKLILINYKYSNTPLEQTIGSLARSMGYESCRASRSEDLADLLCKYKWNKLTIQGLELRLKADTYFITNTPYGYQ